MIIHQRFLLILLCLMTILATDCTIDDAIESIIEEIEQPTVEEPAPIKEENPQEDYVMELKPIKQFSNYVASLNAIYGVDGIKLEKVHLYDTKDNEHLFYDFFMADGKTYFTVRQMVNGDPMPDTDPVQYEQIEKTYYFEQAKADLIEILKKAFPDPPVSEHIEFEDSNFKIIIFPYEKDGETTITSRVSQGSLVVGYLKIDGCMLVDNGLWYSVAERIQTRLEGVYYWPVGGQPRRVLDIGRIY